MPTYLKTYVWSFQIWSCFKTGKISVAFSILATATALQICKQEKEKLIDKNPGNFGY